MIKGMFFLKRKRTWHDYNEFERKMWGRFFKEKTSELQRRFGHSVESYKLAKRYADREMRYLLLQQTVRRNGFISRKRTEKSMKWQECRQLPASKKQSNKPLDHGIM
ncbi:hypothetical protein [Halalkalibacter alkalisediminis]|uniref:Transposase n=1 Tax=Halalkalibacter alkalisediminis TaxID=935616 RepID=A0ABV6NLL0_9BACI|nr:hypothetical protein [Halalkalibacter alkalisediminis]